MLPRTRRLLFVLAIVLLGPVQLYATHIRAGQITAERDLSSTDPLAYGLRWCCTVTRPE
jgi:hypothetical protein